ncbi:MAG TPA: rhodanese-like domain-containing protein [Caulobacteraceae bacterium]|nr:rhodanese-like domain-containing protein [Caulobacteraceae bacterium]
MENGPMRDERPAAVERDETESRLEVRGVGPGTPSDAEKVEPDEVGRLIREGVRLLDLRDPKAFAAGHVRGAVNVPVQALFEHSPGRGAVILYDEDGALIARHCAALRAAIGPMEFFVLDGGLEAWRAAGLPVERRGKR